MEPSGVGPSSGSGPSSPSYPSNDEPSNFSLVELTVLIRTLLRIKQEDLFKETNVDKPLFKFFNENAREVLKRFNLSGDNLARGGARKANKVISYYNSLIDERDNLKLSRLEHFSVEEKAEFMLERIHDFSYTMEKENYSAFLDKYNLNFEDYEESKANLMNLIDEDFEALLQFSARTFIIERNLYILWNLYAFTRQLIRSFLTSHEIIDDYNQKLFNYCENNNEIKSMQYISIFRYLQFYDEFEIFANNLTKNYLENLNIYEENKIQFVYNDDLYVNYFVCQKLSIAEDNGTIYPSQFEDEDEDTNIEDYFKLFYKQHFPKENFSTEEENTIKETINTHPSLYLFYYNLPVKVQQKLEYFVIDKKVISNCVNSKYYLENSTELIKMRFTSIPPHAHEEAVTKIKNYFLPPPPPQHQRQSRRNRGNRGGGNN
uniref:Uncharacterized protein n=1 Tax=Meloidogyne enterolobii TaxID=390850 RepID=A0A6V7UUK5_MELEN|nr:unnamed protein product [Meloidogyne enterolobii]